MNTQYKFVWPDGHESDLVDERQIAKWHSEGYIKDTTLIYISTQNKWVSLKTLTDQHLIKLNIDNPNIKSQSIDIKKENSSIASKQEIFKPVYSISALEKSNNKNTIYKMPYMGIILYCIFVITNFIFSVSSDGNTGSSGLLSKAYIIDLLVLIGLLRRNGFLRMQHRSWVIWAIVRLSFTCLYLLVYLPVTQFSTHQLILGLLWTIAAASIAVALLDNDRKLVKCIVLVICFTLCLGGLIVGQNAYWPFTGLALEQGMKSLSIGPGEWTDKESGIKIYLPTSWVQYSINNKIMPVPNAKTIFANPSKHYIIVILNEYIADTDLGVTTNRISRYLDLVIENRKKTITNLVTLSKTEVNCGPFLGCRTLMTWDNGNNHYSGALTAFDDGWGYWVATLVSLQNKPLSDVQKNMEVFEKSITSTKTIDDRIFQMANDISNENPMFSPKAASLVCRYLQVRRYNYAQSLSFCSEIGEWGKQYLSYEEKSEMKRITASAINLLSENEKTNFYNGLHAGRHAMVTNQSNAPAEMKVSETLFEKAVKSLPNKDRIRLQNIMEKAVVAVCANMN